jgi:hypothetical protein
MHGVVQEAMARIQRLYLSSIGVKSVITVIQGSDDSGQLITISGLKPSKILRLATTMLHWKERVSRYVSIYSSYEKSCIGSTDMIEYNSEWSIRKTTYKPTFRWVSACLEVGIVEKFIDRVSNFYNTATSVLEGGGSVLETSVIQLAQAWLHYWMIGIGNQNLGKQATTLLIKCKDPSLGYFPLDADICAGMPGVDFQLFVLYKRTAFGIGVTQGRLPEPELDMYEEDVKDATMSRDLRKVKLKFGNHKIFEKIVKGMDIPTLEILLKDAEDNPELIYYPESTWVGSKTRIYMKVFEPGVKESLSRHSATARILSASAYILSRPCLTVMINNQYEKISLMKALVTAFSKLVLESGSKLPIEDVFIHCAEYDDLLKTVESFSENMAVQQVKLRTRSKNMVTILERESFDVPLVELCKQQWFERGGRTGLSSSQVDRKWAQAKDRYPFLKNSRTETERCLNMSAVQLRNFLDSLQDRPRKIVLLDSAAKSSSLRSVLSRVYWPCTKIHLKDEGDDTMSISSIRSELFSICSHWMSHPDKMIHIAALLSRSDVLLSKQVPFRLRKLSVIRQSLEGWPKADMIRTIIDQRIGAVGFFTIGQTGWGWNRKGPGEWKGKVLESSCVVEFMDSRCVRIILDKVSSSKELGRTLKEFIESSCSSFPDDYQESDHWLSSDGRINGGRGTMKAIPIQIDSELKVQIFDELGDKEWIVETSNNVLRLKAVFPKGQLITILSDKIFSYEWDPAFKIDEGKPHSHWNNSEPMSLSEIERELSGVLNGTRSQNMRDIKKMNSIKTSSGWNLRSFVEAIANFFSTQISTLDMREQEPRALDRTTLSQEENDLIDELITGNFTADWGGSKFDEMGMNLDDDASDYNIEVEDEDLDRTVALLMEERSETDVRRAHKMPSTNRCFLNLDTLSRIQTKGVSFKQNLLDFRKDSSFSISGILGKVISLILGEDRLHLNMTPDEADAFAQEEESVSLMTSVRTDLKAKELSEEKLEESINQVVESLKTATGALREVLLETKQRWDRLLYVKKYPTQAESIGDRMSTDFLLLCKPIISKVSDRLRFVSEMDKEFYLPIVRSELDKLVADLLEQSSIVPNEEPAYREAVSKVNLTTLLVDLVSELAKTSIEVGGYKTNFAGDSVFIVP